MTKTFGGMRSSSPAVTGSPFGSANSVHTSTLHYAKIRYSRTLYVRKTLSKILLKGGGKDG